MIPRPEAPRLASPARQSNLSTFRRRLNLVEERPSVLNSTSTVRGGAHTKVYAPEYALLQQLKERPILLDRSAAAFIEPTDLDINNRIVPGQAFQDLIQYAGIKSCKGCRLYGDVTSL